MKTCPKCGQTLPVDTHFGLWLVGNHRAILDRVLRAGKNGVSGQALFDYIYSGTDGGPAIGINVIAVQVSQLNRKLKTKRKKIVNEHRGRGTESSYHLVDL